MMRFKTLVLIPLIAVLATPVVHLPISQSHTSANAPQIVSKSSNESKMALQQYLLDRETVAASRSTTRVSINNRIVNTAKKYVGTPYCHGGESTRCFDCSGYTQYVFAKNGINIPRGTDQQLNSVNVISRQQAIPGDLVFFLSKGGYAYHVGIYYGNNTVLHSPKPGRRVKTEQIWSTNIVFARQY